MTLLRLLYSELFGPSKWAREESQLIAERTACWNARIAGFERLLRNDPARLRWELRRRDGA